MRQGGLQKEQRKEYPLRRGGGRQGGGVGLLRAASVQEHRSHFWTLPPSPVSSLVHLPCLQPQSTQGCCRPFSSEGAWGGVGLLSSTPLLTPRNAGRSTDPPASLLLLPHPSLQVWEQLTLPAPPCSPPGPALTWGPQNHGPPWILEQAGWGAGLSGCEKAQKQQSLTVTPFPCTCPAKTRRGCGQGGEGNRTFSNVLEELHAELKEFPNPLSWEIVFLHEKPRFWSWREWQGL